MNSLPDDLRSRWRMMIFLPMKNCVRIKAFVIRGNIGWDINYHKHMLWRCPRRAVRNLPITAVLRKARRTLSLWASLEDAAVMVAAGWQCQLNKCPWRVVGKGTNRLEPQTQCLVMAVDGFAQWVPLDMAGSPGYYTSRCPSVMFLGRCCCQRLRARTHVRSLRFDFGTNRRTNDRN